jgi:cob(I)alamin adenosyltransferase
VDAYGEVDELNAVLRRMGGWCDADIARALESIQKDLFALGTSSRPVVADCGRTKAAVTTADVERLEQTIDGLEAEPPAQRSSARRAVRRIASSGAHCMPAAERRVIALGADAVEPILIVYLNRLSDLLFVMARAVNHREGVPEVEW